MHLLQSPPWGQTKSQFGWSAQSLSLPHTPGPAQVLYRKLSFGFNLAYVPKGPEIDWHDADAVADTLARLKQLAARFPTLFIKVEPDAPDNPTLARQFLAAGFRPGQPVQPPNTIIIDIAGSDETILAGMKSKWRYNIRLARRKGVTVRAGSAADLPLFHRLNKVTTARNDFAGHSLAYYQAAFSHFAPDHCALLLAELAGQPLAGLMIFAWEERAYYLYGASNNQHRNLMPTYLLQWEAIQWAKTHGCRAYDLWGIPDAPAEILEATFSDRSDGLWGVYRHKRGYGGRVVRSIGAFDYVPPIQLHKRLLYAALARYLDRRSR